jgi:4-hydroxy-2-oxoheptanedioate aldolase
MRSEVEEDDGMLVNTAKQKMLQGKPAYGFSLGLGSPIVAEIVSRAGPDFVMVDNQHGSWGPDSTLAALIAIHGSPATPMARVARNDYTMIGRLLDEGMLGIIVPMVHSAEDARAAAQASRFPPIGGRSWGWARAAIYGADYSDVIGEQLFLAVQIESAQAVENAEAILATPGVDGCWVGPSDMALSMGIHPRDRFTNERHARNLEQVVVACRNTGKIAGISASDPHDAVVRARQGYQFIVAENDGNFLMNGIAAAWKILQG